MRIIKELVEIWPNEVCDTYIAIMAIALALMFFVPPLQELIRHSVILMSIRRYPRDMLRLTDTLLSKSYYYPFSHILTLSCSLLVLCYPDDALLTK